MEQVNSEVTPLGPDCFKTLDGVIIRRVRKSEDTEKIRVRKERE